jgi:hypothetical protein
MRVMFLTCVTLLAVTASVVIANMVGDRFATRIDVTHAGNQRLAPRTQRLLDHLSQTYRVVVAADMKALDLRSRERAKDVLTEMHRSSSKLEFQFLDTGVVTGLDQFKKLVRDLASRDANLIKEQQTAIELAGGGALALSAYLNDTLSPALLEIENGISPGTQAGQTNRAYFEQAAAGARLLAKDLTGANNKASDELKSKLDDIAIPATDKAAAALMGILSPAVDQMDDLAKQLKRFADSEVSAGPARDLARPLVPAVEQRRDQAAVVLESLRKLKRLDLLRIIDALRSANAAIVIGPPDVGLAAIDLESLMPSAAWLEATGTGKADLHRRAEELIATSISALVNPIRPIVVVVHAEPHAFFDHPEVFKQTISQLAQNLQFRGVDMIEWAVVSQNEPPRLKLLNPDGKRPVVYVGLPTDSSTSTNTPGALSGVQRAAKLGEVLNALSQGGKNILLSVSPSVLPTYGQPDPLTPVLTRFGLAADSGRPLLTERTLPAGRAVAPDHLVLPEESTGLMGGAVRGLPMLMPWPVALFEKPQDGKVRLTTTHLYSLPAGESTWAESQWLRLWQVPENQRTLIGELPVFDKDRDGRWPEGRPSGKEQSWLLAAAVERSEVGSQPQRLVAVGANWWFFDRYTQPQVSVEGRTGSANPGNCELFESAVYWLAGQDELIAQSPSAQAFAIVQPMETKVLSGLRITTIFGLPAAVLLLGLLYRLVRG